MAEEQKKKDEPSRRENLNKLPGASSFATSALIVVRSRCDLLFLDFQWQTAAFACIR